VKRRVIKAFFDCNPHAQWCVISGIRAYPFASYSDAVHMALRPKSIMEFYSTIRWMSVSALLSDEVAA
jgi:hypothetical protein